MGNREARILIVEDDEELASLIADYLTDNGLQVHVIYDGVEVDKAVQTFAPDLIILDQMLPSKDGLQICKELRPTFAGPIVFLTARSGWVDEVVGLEIGADDYLGKPVEPRLLLARVHLLLRRAETTGAVRSPSDPEGLEIDNRAREAKLGTRRLDLTDAEFDLLVYLKQHAGEQLARPQLARDLCDAEYDGLDRTIDVRISRLRAKLGDDPKHPRWIKSIRGVGYLFLDHDQE